MQQEPWVPNGVAAGAMAGLGAALGADGTDPLADLLDGGWLEQGDELAGAALRRG